MPDDKTYTLARDLDLAFPEFVLLRASAGSGKTHTLSLRFVQFLLSAKVRASSPADLRNMLAITFTKNAAREMKERILDWLKAGYFGDAGKTREVLGIVDLDPARLREEAGAMVDRILAHYTDFQVETIDGFMAAVFKASALDLGHSPDFEIVLDNTSLIEYAFARYLRRAAPGTAEGKNLQRIAEYILVNMKDETSFPWDPAPEIRKKLMAFHARLAARTGVLRNESLDAPKARTQVKIAETAAFIAETIERHGLERNAKSVFWSRMKRMIEARRFSDLADVSFKTDPVKKPKRGAPEEPYTEVLKAWDRLERLTKKYLSLFARSFFHPYLLAHESLDKVLDDLKRRQEMVFIEDINRELFRYIEEGVVPDIYFRLGDRIYHYLIDEFQDTSIIQWANLMPLIENSLAQSGSLFAVGDTKQAIYGFRAADYRIMAAMEEPDGNPFPSIGRVKVRELPTNYRSRERVLDYVKSVFLEKLKPGTGAALPAPEKEDEDPESLEYFRSVASLNKLNGWSQDVLAKHRGTGYAEYVILDRDDADPPEKAEIQRRVSDLNTRGFAWSDIAVLTYKNDSVVNVAAWLNEIDVPFIPYSSLDIRKRKIAAEIMAFLRFLDSPPDDLSFAEFLLSRILARALAADGAGEGTEERHRFLFECRRTRTTPLYVAFRRDVPGLWTRYFEPFFKTAGYAPLYDLVTQVFRAFRLFDLFPEEEAALAKFLEAIKDFEGQGRNDLREFLESAEDESSEDSGLNIDVPSGLEAVRIMSIHKAKGLEFPAVVLLLYGEKFKPDDFHLHEEDGRVEVWKLTKPLAAADNVLQTAYDETRRRQNVDRLNALYVALTRASVELHVVGVKRDGDKYPFNILGDAPFASSEVKPAPDLDPRPPAGGARP
jgi:ATP-dependent helicase/nuclease subunit A